MKDIIIDTLIDTLKLVPFLFIAFLLIELFEHKFSKKSIKVVESSGKYGPILGSILGIIPQCGFSVMATNLYVTRLITLGTLISIYLSTSDEMLPILISEKAEFSLIIKILLIKLFIGMLVGFIIDKIFKVKKEKKNYDICEEEHCHCKESIIISSLKHTLNIVVFILLINFILNICFNYLGQDYLSKILLKDSFFGPFISSLIGLIPNCGASVMLTELYINNAINFGSLISGLLTGSGIAIMILFKTNKHFLENLKVIGILYIVGVLSGIIIELII
ncbi:MAG: arsenic efflux protein [Bacilli bacterium]|nr:arsenic efflux protein [Bacilli bacterium]